MDSTQNTLNLNSNISDFHESLRDEINEIMKYKWYMGERMHRDPLEVYTLDDICKEWILNYAETFRILWQQRKKDKSQNV